MFIELKGTFFSNIFQDNLKNSFLHWYIPVQSIFDLLFLIKLMQSCGTGFVINTACKWLFSNYIHFTREHQLLFWAKALLAKVPSLHNTLKHLWLVAGLCMQHFEQSCSCFIHQQRILPNFSTWYSVSGVSGVFNVFSIV